MFTVAKDCAHEEIVNHWFRNILMDALYSLVLDLDLKDIIKC
jgi:hypothetical protein